MNKVYGVIFNDIDKKYYYLGDEEFSDGTTAKKDAFGNKNYL